MISGRDELVKIIRAAMRRAPAHDPYTEITLPRIADDHGNGVDALMTAPLLLQEASRYNTDVTGNTSQVADAVYQSVFLNHSPISDAAQATLWALKKMGLAMGDRSLSEARRAWRRRKGLDHTLDALDMANLAQVAVRVDLFDEIQQTPAQIDDRLYASIRLDTLSDLNIAWPLLAARGVTGRQEVRTFLMRAVDKAEAKSFAWLEAPSGPFLEDALYVAEILSLPVVQIPAQPPLPPQASDLSRRIAKDGLSFSPYGSGATVPALLPGLWTLARHRITEALLESYLSLLGSGWPLSPGEVAHDIQQFLCGSAANKSALPKG